MPFVTTFHPGVKNLKQILMQKMESNSKSAINQNYIEKPPIIIQSYYSTHHDHKIRHGESV